MSDYSNFLYFCDEDVSIEEWQIIYNTWHEVITKAMYFHKWREQLMWGKTCLKGRFTTRGGAWLFENEEDAIAFKLRWI